MRDDASLIRVLQHHCVPHAVIGGWAVITHGYVRYTRDIDMLIPDAPDARTSPARDGEPPLDFAGVAAAAIETSMDEVTLRVADLAHLVAFKRLAGRLHDRLDLDELRAIGGGELPILPVPGLDEDGFSE